MNLGVLFLSHTKSRLPSSVLLHNGLDCGILVKAEGIFICAILIPHPYNDVKFPNVLRLENSNQLADAVISLFEAIDDNGALSA